MGKKWVVFVLTLTLLFWFIVESSQAQGKREYHGADSIFEKEGIIILWGIFKGSTEETSWVYIKIIQTGKGPAFFQFFGVEAVDPFSNQKEWVVKGEVFKKENMVKSIRASFREKTARRVLFYEKAEDLLKENPAMIVYYLGVPDTSPEFMTEREIEDYFAKALERLKRR
jgi:hypothetical protein